MIAISPSLIPRIDEYAEKALCLPPRLLMERAGAFCAETLCRLLAKERARKEGRILVFCGGGNNGGDGYAASLALRRAGYDPVACDLFEKGQKSEAGRYFYDRYAETLGRPLTGEEGLSLLEKEPPLAVVDAIFGTGGALRPSPLLSRLASLLREPACPILAIDAPLGTDGETGQVADYAVRADVTCCLSFPKYGLFSYPAREYVGELLTDELGLPTDALGEVFSLSHHLTAPEELASLLPKRDRNTHKGSYGRALLLSGSAAYPGAGLLSVSGALRAGAGLTYHAGEAGMRLPLLTAFPEAILAELPPLAEARDEDVLALCEGKDAVLIGPGSGVSRSLGALLRTLIRTPGAPLVIDADAIHSFSLEREASLRALEDAKRKVIFTPHPKEMGMLLGISTSEVQARRLPLARTFAERYPAVLLLKGAATVVCEGDRFAINLSGSPALSKGGTGDVLAGALTALLAQGVPPYEAARLAALLHGMAGDRLSRRFSELGVLPSELPMEMASLLGEAMT